MKIYNAEIYTGSGHYIKGFVEIKRGRIARVEEGECRPSRNDINAEGKKLYPGFVDIHTHMGFICDGASEDECDVNEGSDPVYPALRAEDGINYYDTYFEDAVKAGVTAVVTGVGSLNAIGGSMIALKTAAFTEKGTRSLDRAMLGTVAVKFALGENPKGYYGNNDEAPQTRMATAALIREALFKARQYKRQKEDAQSPSDEPEFDLNMEALLPLLRGEVQAHIHCHRSDDILTALRICEEFSLKPLLVHCTEGYLIADIIAEKLKKLGGGAVVGPILCDRGKPELAKAAPKNAAVLAENGIKTAICTDHPEVMIDLLPLSAAYCVKYGLDEGSALDAVTSTAAELVDLDKRIGRIAKGLDADLVLMDGSPLELSSEVIMTIINGQIVYNRN